MAGFKCGWIFHGYWSLDRRAVIWTVGTGTHSLGVHEDEYSTQLEAISAVTFQDMSLSWYHPQGMKIYHIVQYLH